jgi:two-component system sensor histidine kinase MtrB
VTSVRGRLLVTLVGLVALTTLVLGVGSYAYVATSLRDQHRAEAVIQTNFNVAVLAVERLGPDTTRDDVAVGRLVDAIQARGGVGTVVDFGDGDPIASGLDYLGAYGAASSELRALVSGGRIGYERTVVAGRPVLATGARMPPGGPDFYFYFDAAATEEAIARLGQALLVGGGLLVALAVLVGGAVARGVLRPVREAGAAAERIADGDLSTRLEADGNDEFAAWAASFNRMAGSLAETVAELRAHEDRQRAFVADVSHELRTPLTALVQEADILRAHLDTMPRDARRAGQLLVSDVARLRQLVDDLMEISRFDADAEIAAPIDFEVSTFVRAVIAARAPHARTTLPADGTVVVADRRRLERILANLLDNAVQHAPDAPLEVVATVGSGVLVIVVADRGPGVPPDALPHLFERFTKADPSRSRGGSGLGLAIAAEHAEVLGGTLEGTLRDGGGLAFVLRVPVTEPLHAGDEPVILAEHAGSVSPPQPEHQP